MRADGRGPWSSPDRPLPKGPQPIIATPRPPSTANAPAGFRRNGWICQSLASMPDGTLTLAHLANARLRLAEAERHVAHRRRS
jgi:hypothetical protein